MLEGLVFFIRFGFQKRKSYLAARAGAELSKTAMVFVQIVLPGYLLNELFGQRRGRVLAGYFLFYALSCLFCGLCGNILKGCADNCRDLFRGDFEKYMLEKQLKCDFVQLELLEYQDRKEKAKQFISGQWNQFGDILEKFFSLCGNLFTLVGTGYIVASLDIRIVVIFFVLLGLNTWLGFVLKGRRAKLFAEFAPVLRGRGYFENVTKSTEYAKEIRIGGLSEWLLEKYDRYMDIFCKKTAAIYRHDVAQKSAAAVTGFIEQGAAYAYLLWCAAAQSISLGQFTVYLNAVHSFQKVLGTIVDEFLEIARYGAFYQDFKQVVHMAPGQRKGDREPDGEPFEIEFRHVSFRYPGQEEFALKDVSLKIKKGEKISVVGENGAGKTTFVKLLARLYDPMEGQILLNGVDIRKIDYDSYMRLFSVVFQDFKLFKLSIRENILLAGQEQEDEGRLWNVLGTMGMSDKIKGLKNGLDTQLYKDFDAAGMEPSGGEGQKLALCRAYYRDAPFMILDEPTAALDPEAECEIYENFQGLVRGRTALFISHRLAGSGVCDRILVFQKGRLIEEGSHEKLMEEDSLYRELFLLQAQAFRAK